MPENLRAKHKKTQYHTSYSHVAITIKHKDANAMLNSDQTYYVSETTHTTQNHHKNPITHSQFNSLNSHIVMTDIPQTKSKKKHINISD
jgi:hypothetical protein